jgi:hypothetical protein
VSRRAALILLEKVLDIDDVELAGELTRFLGPVPRSPPSSIPSEEQTRQNHHSLNNSDITPLVDVGITPDDEEYCIPRC